MADYRRVAGDFFPFVVYCYLVRTMRERKTEEDGGKKGETMVESEMDSRCE